MTVYNDGTPVAQTTILTLAEAQLNPQLTDVDETLLQSWINAVTRYLQNHPAYIIGTITDFSTGYEDLKEACIKLITQLLSSTNTSVANGPIQSESLGDYSYTISGLMARALMTPEIGMLLIGYERRNSPAMVVRDTTTDLEPNVVFMTLEID